MTAPHDRDCQLARDLFIPYLAGEISLATRDWLEGHLEQCDQCRLALAAMHGESGMGRGPSADGSHPALRGEAAVGLAAKPIIARIQRRNVISRVVKIGLLALVVWLGGLIAWSSLAYPGYASAAKMVHAVPPSTVTPEQALNVDLSEAGLTMGAVHKVELGAWARWHDRWGRSVTIRVYQLPSAADAADMFSRTVAEHLVQVSPLRVSDGETHSVAISWVPFGREYLWQTDRWLVAIRVPIWLSSVDARVRQIRDSLIRQYEQYSPR